ncbi:glycosyltransferase family 8 protein [Laetiporus sulphureus 93-53]|uniref:Glycosyltransferase family 8 protein n=1 Tax=Laetiporus sulphureus 93-53 TaxID=1314785 RepID=A0A165DQ84_9APHY|nr:glycosyltransferase family 8 protein [Laetiporus sulphureus 93-53]KZT05387.1 glycosyltransferase family 8 protein [Laetiporus sulphureus 93-53]
MSLFTRYKGYTPLWPNVSTFRQTNRQLIFLVLGHVVVLAISVAYNAYMIKRLEHWWPTTPLDNYQHLNTQPLVDEGFFNALAKPSSEENAVVTCMYTDSYATAIANLGHSLNRVNSTAKRLLFYLPENISPDALCVASATGFIPHPVTRIPPPHNGKGTHERLMDAYSKLNLWTLSESGIKAVVHLDADTLVMRNFDELFSLPYNFGAAPDVYVGLHGFAVEFNTGVIFARPSMDVFNDMINKMQTATYDAIQADQAFLNQYYAADAVRLPYAYNANLAIKKRKPEMWQDLKGRARIVHYTLVKPFLAEADNTGKTIVTIDGLEDNVKSRMGEFDGVFDEELQEWLDIWKETYQLYGKKLNQCMRAGTPS